MKKKKCYHAWQPAISPKYEVCEKCGTIRKVEKRQKGLDVLRFLDV